MNFDRCFRNFRKKNTNEIEYETFEEDAEDDYFEKRVPMFDLN